MAESGGIRAGKAFVEFFVQDRGFTRGLDQVARKLKSVGDSITDIGKKTLAIGSAITAPLLIAAQRFAAMGDEVNKASQRTGVGVESLGELKYAAEQSGAEFSALEGGLRKMQKTLFEAASGMDTAQDALRGVGLSVADLQHLSPDEQLQLIGDRLNDITDPATRAGLAMEIFGKSGTGLLPLFAQGAEGMQALRDRSRELGLIFDQDAANAATTFGDALADVWAQVKMVTFHVGHAVVQALQPFMSSVHRILRVVIDWTKENKGLIFTVLTAGAALMALGGSIVGVGLAIKLVGVALASVVSAFKLITAAVGLLSSPILLVGALVVGLVAYFVYASGNGAKLMAWLGDKFEVLSETAKTAFGGIADALRAGDIALAAQILWTALKLAWIQGTQHLQNTWIAFKSEIIKTAVGAFYGVLDVWTNVYATLETLWVSASGAFVEIWHAAVQEVTKLFDGLEQKEREREKARIRQQLARTDLAPNARKQLERQLANVDEQAGQVQAGREKQDQEAAERRAKELQDRVAAIEAQRQKKLKEHADAEQAIGAAADANAQKEIADLEKERQDLEGKLKELRDRAAKGAAAAGGGGLLKTPALDELDDVLKRNAKLDVKSTGIFNIAALQSLQSSPTQDAIKKAAQETAKHTKRIADRAGIAFA